MLCIIPAAQFLRDRYAKTTNKQTKNQETARHRRVQTQVAITTDPFETAAKLMLPRITKQLTTCAQAAVPARKTLDHHIVGR